MSLTTIQACILLGTIHNSEGRAEAGSVYYAIAARVASIIDLPNKPGLCEVEKEVSIRGM